VRVHRCAFFERIADRVNQMMGNLFYRKVPPSEILSMGYKDMTYWNEWHKLMEDAEKPKG